MNDAASLRDLTLALAVTTVVLDAAEDQKVRLRAALLQALETVGADSARAELPDGTRVAKVSTVTPAVKATVSDEDAFTAHVAAASPHNVETRTTVRPAYTKVLLERLIPTADGEAVDPDTGEIVPGVTFRQGYPYVSCRFDKGGRDAVADAIRSGALRLDMTTPLPEIGA